MYHYTNLKTIVYLQHCSDFSREEKQYSINKAATTRAHNGYNEQDEQNNSNNAITNKKGNNNVIKGHENKEKKLAHKIKRKSRKSFSFSNNANYSGKFIQGKLFVPLLCIVILLSSGYPFLLVE